MMLKQNMNIQRSFFIKGITLLNLFGIVFVVTGLDIVNTENYMYVRYEFNICNISILFPEG